MKRSRIAVLFFLVSLTLVSCSKIDSLFNNGEPVTELRDINPGFRVVAIYNNVNVKLMHDNNPRIELNCPKNLIEKVTTDVVGDTLFIRNQNDFNWLRSFDYSIDLTVYYDSLRAIQFASNGNLLCTDSIRGIREIFVEETDENADTLLAYGFNLQIIEGSGDIDLTFNCDALKTNFINGTSAVVFRGRTGYNEIIIRSYGNIHAEALESNLVRVESLSTNDTYVWAKTSLHARLFYIGNVYYKGHPTLVDECHGEGRVIKME